MEYTTTNYESLSSKLNVVCNPVLILLADELLSMNYISFLFHISYYSNLYFLYYYSKVCY